MSKTWDPEDIFDILANDEARQILVAASIQPVSADELETICDASLTTIYRRINTLLDFGLLSEEQVVEPDGTQYKEYRTDLEEITIQLEEGGFNVDITIRKDTVDKFGELWRDLEAGTKASEPDQDETRTSSDGSEDR